jgi:predicted phage terminase large subunit-like protein
MLETDPLLAKIDEVLAMRLAMLGGGDDEEALRLEGSLIDFVEAAWPWIDGAEYQPNWAVEGLCDHLQAVADGQIKRLLVNFPPRASKTTVASICFPAFLWAQRERTYLKGPQVKILTASYGYNLSMMISNASRQLILSPWYQRFFGQRFSLRADQASKANFANSAGGVRLATSVGGSLLGIGGDIVIIDDPHDTAGIESAADREAVLRFWQEISSTRLNNPKESAIVVVMQRLHEEDVSGKILSDSAEGEWEHYCIPAEFVSARCCQTILGWTDPRGLDDDGEPLLTFPDKRPRDDDAAAILEEREGALFWPERFGPAEIAALKSSLGPYMASGRLQQSPQPKGGELFRPDWWQLWDKAANGNRYPSTSYRVASLDGAFTADEANDPSALTVWGVFQHPELKAPRVILMDAWRKHLALHGNPTPRLPDEIPQAGDTEAIVRRRQAKYRQRAGPEWGLVELVRATCLKFDVDVLLIEKAASGISVAQEMQRLYATDGIAVHLIPPLGDKVARAHAVVPMFAQGLIFAPNIAWADDLVIAEMAMFPHGKRDDLTDSATQALGFLRRTGVVRTDAEVKADEIAGVTQRPTRRRLYPV